MADNNYSQNVSKLVGEDTLRRGFLAQLKLMELTGKELQKEFQNQCAETLIRAGLSLIPSDVLNDNQFVVSRGVYDAAKHMTKED